MRTTRSFVGVMGGFAAGLFVAIAAGAMLGSAPQQPAAVCAKVDPRIEIMNKMIADAEDQLAAADALVRFWQQEGNSQDGDVMRMQAEAAESSSGGIGFFLDRAKGLSTRAAHAQLDARLAQMQSARKVQALKADLAVK